MGKTDPWCCAFVGAVAAVAGVVESVPLSAHCDRFIKAILAKGGYEVDIPQLGDLAIFNWDGNGESDHIGIVCRVPENGRVTTIEGNNNDAVNYRTFTNAPVRFFRPAWSNCVGKPASQMIDITENDVVTWEKYRDFYKELLRLGQRSKAFSSSLWRMRWAICEDSPKVSRHSRGRSLRN